MSISNISKSTKPLYILGAGNIGLFFASCIKSSLLDIELPVRLLIRSKHRLNLFRDQQNNAFVHTFLEKKTSLNDVAIPADIIGQDHLDSPIYNLLLSTKAPDAAKALDSIKDRLAPSANVFIMTNGALAVKDELENVLSIHQHSENNKNMDYQPNLILGSTTHGVYIEGGRVIQAGEGQTFIEVSSSDHKDDNNDDDNDQLLQIQNLIHLWNRSGLNVQGLNKEQMFALQWKKLATNCAINPLTALLQCYNGKLLEKNTINLMNAQKLTHETQDIMDDIIKEVSNVAMLSSPYEKNEDLTYDSLTKFVHDVIKRTAKNKSSMLQDILHKRQPTEIQYLNGFVSRVGRDHFNLPMPMNTSICSEVESLY